jgi:alkylation response protein AidB-like acyl-CoA dehydrogenase
MELEFSAHEESFRNKVREFFATDYPAQILDKIRGGQRLTREDHVLSQQALQARGWLGVGWPAEFGGAGFSPVLRYIFEEELERAGAPNIIPMGVIYVGPIIIAFGNAQQQARWLPDILASRAMWAQGYSEPSAGSDLASLALRADREGNAYVLNGTKIWTTLAQWADWIFCLARTSSEQRKQGGISFICVDMKSPGISVYPIITMDGAHELNRVQFDNVRVPIDNRVGEEGQGWRYANVLLANERLSYAHIGQKKADLARLRKLAGTMISASGTPRVYEPLFATRLASLEIEVATLEISLLRSLAGAGDPQVVSSLKIQATQCTQRITELHLELAARNISPWPDRHRADWQAVLPYTASFGPLAADAYLRERAQTIYGGATEIQKNIIWRAISK